MDETLGRRTFLRQAGRLALTSAVWPYTHSPAAEAPTLKIAAVGDCMIARPLSSLPPGEFLPLAKILQTADAGFGNFEMTLAESDAPPSYHDSCAYVHLRADMRPNQIIAEELKWAGFKLMGLANNHSMDFGDPGLQSTMTKLERVGLAFAGAGRTLAEARAPAYCDTSNGRIALVACASTFPYGSFAADGNGEVAARPGLSPCHLQTTYRLEPVQFDNLKQAGSALGVSARTADATYNFLGHRFIPGTPSGVLTSTDPADLTAITAAVHRASRNADLTLLGIHAHEGAGSAEIPARFLQPFAHACIDAGANAFIGHGPHVLRGIEIYKHRPIFYSLGNFIFHGESEAQIPPEIYQTCGVTGSDPSDVFDKVLQNFSADSFWFSVIAVPAFRNGELTDLRLYPITLQSEFSRSRRGTPALATGESARKVISKLGQLSEPFGTKISFQDGIGVVAISG